MNTKKTLTVVVERNEDGYWARIETIPDFLATGYGETMEELDVSLKEILSDYLNNEGKDNSDFVGISANDIEFIYEYDLQAFFEEFSFLKISDVAKIAGLNESLVRQYAKGLKQASDKQAKKIQEAVHKIAKTLASVQLS